MEAKDLDVQVTENTVSISGERRTETKTEDKGVTRSEFHYGKIQRVIPLPTQVSKNTNTWQKNTRMVSWNLTLPKTEQEKKQSCKTNPN